MKLFNSGEAYIAREKITRYLLNHNHPDGESKAVFFTRFGFDVEHWDTFAESLRLHGATQRVVDVSEGDWGITYVVDGKIETPDGRNPRIRTVWIVSEFSDTPKLVTAFPLRRRDA